MPSIHAQRRSCNPTGSVAVFVYVQKILKKTIKKYRLIEERSVVLASWGYRQGRIKRAATRAVADEAPGRLGLGGPWPPLQEILRRDNVVRTSCPGPNDVLFRRRDEVQP